MCTGGAACAFSLVNDVTPDYVTPYDTQTEANAGDCTALCDPDPLCTAFSFTGVSIFPQMNKSNRCHTMN